MAHPHHFPIPPIPPVVLTPTYSTFDKRTPIVLLPVRVETRYFAAAAADQLELRVRVFPDAVHVTTARRAPTEAELEAARGWWTAYHRDGAESLATQRLRDRLSLAFGDARADWLVATQTPTVAADGTLQFPAVTTSEDGGDPEAIALPDRFAVVGLAGATQVFVSWSLAVAATLPVGLTKLADAGQWQVSFEVAREKGVAVGVPLSRADAARLTHLVVLGVREEMTPQAASLALADLFERHATELGASLLPVGTPTNHTPGARATARPQDATGSAPAAGSDGDRMCRALGIDGAAFAHVAGGQARTDEAANAINTALWPATLGYFLDEIIDPAVAATTRPAIHQLFVEHVRARGPFPALCLGRQPYGILPASSLSSWRTDAGADDPAAAALRGLLPRWHAAVANVTSVAESADPLTALGNVLAMQPTSIRWLKRTVENVEIALPSWLGGTGALADAVTAIARAAVMSDLALAGLHTEPRVHDWIFANDPRDLHLPVVGNAAYIDAMAKLTSVAPLVDHTITGAHPRSLLYYLLRAATLLVMKRAGEVVAAVPEAERHDVAVRTGAAQPLWTRLSSALGAAILIGPVADHRAALSTLATRPSDELQRLTAETIDLVSHRLDAWITALATRRLFDARAHGVSGSYLGAYAWLTAPAVPAQPARDGAPAVVDSSSDGHVLAPSLAHARTAALLRAGFAARPSSELAITLDSRRVRAARWLLDGMREGQSLASLLGYRIERLLVDEGHGELIAHLQQQFPLASSAAGAVPEPRIDGLAAHKAWQASQPTDALAAPAAAIAEMLDGVADLLLAESVHQHVLGHPDRAAIVLEALEAGSVVPPDPEVVRSPIAARRATWSVALSLPTSGQAWPGDDKRARSLANPRINAWVASLLGQPATLGATVRCTLEGAQHELAVAVVDLDLGPLDLVALARARFDESPLARAFAARAPQGAQAVTCVPSPALRRASTLACAVRDLLQPARPAGDVDETAAATATQAALDRLRTDLADTGGAARISAFGDPSLASSLADRTTPLAGSERVLPISGLPAVGSLALPTSISVAYLKLRSDKTRWLADMARVRPALEALEVIDLATRAVGSPLSVVAYDTTGNDVVVVVGPTSSPIAGLIVDHWTESTPVGESSAAVAFHHMQPHTRAPQAVLVAVPPDPHSGWTFERLLATVTETFELARVRLARPHQVTGALLPAAYLSESLDASAVSTPLDEVAVQVTMEES